ncbi:MAG: hypothetical protein KIG53_00320, partial [Oscillospiraceae bacterium]|nr:hypothetical protein [Oscillospiraceae bacterium]
PVLTAFRFKNTRFSFLISASALSMAYKKTAKCVVLNEIGGSNGKLFGSVTAKEIAAVVSNEFKITVDKRKITVDDIKAFGTYNAQDRLHPKVTASFKVQVVEL